jgi:hypothetical protein
MHAVGAESFDQSGKPCGAAREGDHAPAVFSEPCRDGGAKAGGYAGDESGFAGHDLTYSKKPIPGSALRAAPE